MLRRRGGPGILGTMARTAVIAGTASSVSNKVNASAAAKSQAAHQQAVAQQSAQIDQNQMQERLATLEASASGGDMSVTIEKLKQLGQLKDAGVLNEEEFAAAKAKVLAG